VKVSGIAPLTLTLGWQELLLENMPHLTLAPAFSGMFDARLLGLQLSA